MSSREPASLSEDRKAGRRNVCSATPCPAEADRVANEYIILIIFAESFFWYPKNDLPGFYINTLHWPGFWVANFVGVIQL